METYPKRMFVLLSIMLLLMSTMSPAIKAVAQDAFDNSTASDNTTTADGALTQDDNSSIDLNNTIFNDTIFSSLPILAAHNETPTDSDSDRLPDFYETNTTGTDLQCNDSDSGLTPANESGNGIIDGLEDFDTDGLPNYMEYKLDTDPFNPDTDGDGLTDFYEQMATFTSPLMVSTFGNGTSDAALDLDKDGLTNLQEQVLWTNPLSDDSDLDGLSDSDEAVRYHTDPLNPDTDSDGLPDKLELAIGTDPLNPDSDGDGVPDGEDSFSQHFSDDALGISVSITGSAWLQETMTIRQDENPYAALLRLPGIVTGFVDINASSGFESMALRFSYDVARLNGSDEEGLKLYYLDPFTGMPIEAPAQRLDTASHYIEASPARLALYFIADDTEWAPDWNMPVSQPMAMSGSFGLTNVMAMALQLNGVPGGAQSEGAGDGSGVTFALGDMVNIGLRVHNTGDIDANDSVLVNFYEGDPDADGVYVGDTTISDGIPVGGSKTAVLHGYTINYSEVEIYAKVDPLNVIAEKDEINNIAHKTLRTGPQDADSDGDGLVDADELDGMYDMRSHSYVYTDPYESDTDGDGLADGQEMGVKQFGVDGYPYYVVNSYPDNPDSDDDGLGDYDEVTAHTISIADDRTSSINFWNALASGADGEQYLHTVSVTSDPLKADTDGDQIDDCTELMMGTNPGSQDTDTDHIPDNLEESCQEDATTFDVTAPEISVSYVWLKPVPVLNIEYEVLYTVTDYGGVSNVKVSKNGNEKHSYSVPLGVARYLQYTTFDSSILETFLDEFGTTRVDVYAKDWNGNENSVMAYHRESMFSQWSVWLTDILPGGEEIAYTMGMFTGGYDSSSVWAYDMTVGMVTFPLDLVNNPLMFYDGFSQLAGMIESDPDFLHKLLVSYAESINEKARLENPYAPGDPLYSRFEAGWYEGYYITTILTTVYGGELMKTVKTSEEFVSIIGPLKNRMNDFKALIKDSKMVGGLTAKVGLLLAKGETVSDEAQKLAKVIKNVRTATKKTKVAKLWDEIGTETKEKVAGFESEAGDLLGTMPGDVSSIISGMTYMEGATVNKVFSFAWSGESDLTMFKGKLFNMKYLGASDDEIGSYLDNILAVEGQKGANKFIRNMNTYDVGAFKDMAFEAERASYLKTMASNIVVEYKKGGRGVDVKAMLLDGKVLYAEQKTVREALKFEKVTEFIGSAQIKLADLGAEIIGNPTKLEINARAGMNLRNLDGSIMDEATFVSKINEHMSLNYKSKLIETIEIFKPGDGNVGSLILRKGPDGLFQRVSS